MGIGRRRGTIRRYLVDPDRVKYCMWLLETYANTRYNANKEDMLPLQVDTLGTSNNSLEDGIRRLSFWRIQTRSPPLDAPELPTNLPPSPSQHLQ